MATKAKDVAKEATQPCVVVHTPLLHDGELYQPGATVELTVPQAARQAGNVIKPGPDYPALEKPPSA